MNEAALFAARENQQVERMLDFEIAKDKVLMGAERRSMIISDEEKRGRPSRGRPRVLAALLTTRPGPQGHHHPARHGARCDQDLPTEDKHNYNAARTLNDWIANFLGGRLAEEAHLQEHDAPAPANDLERSTEMARKTACQYAMSE